MHIFICNYLKYCRYKITGSYHVLYCTVPLSAAYHAATPGLQIANLNNNGTHS